MVVLVCFKNVPKTTYLYLPTYLPLDPTYLPTSCFLFPSVFFVWFFPPFFLVVSHFSWTRDQKVEVVQTYHVLLRPQHGVLPWLLETHHFEVQTYISSYFSPLATYLDLNKVCFWREELGKMKGRKFLIMDEIGSMVMKLNSWRWPLSICLNFIHMMHFICITMFLFTIILHPCHQFHLHSQILSK